MEAQKHQSSISRSLNYDRLLLQMVLLLSLKYFYLTFLDLFNLTGYSYNMLLFLLFVHSHLNNRHGWL